MPGFSVHFNAMEQTAQRNVQKNMLGLTQTMTRLSTGKRINSAKDDPAGFIGAELLKSENVEIRAKLKTNQQLGNKLSTIDRFLGQIGDLLLDLKGSVVEGANSGALSDDQIDALQLGIDYALDAINRIAKTATFKGEKVLDGLLDVLNGLGLSDSTQQQTESTAKTSCGSCSGTTATVSAAKASTGVREVFTDGLLGVAQMFSLQSNGNDSGVGLFIEKLLANLGSGEAELVVPDEKKTEDVKNTEGKILDVDSVVESEEPVDAESLPLEETNSDQNTACVLAAQREENSEPESVPEEAETPKKPPRIADEDFDPYSTFVADKPGEFWTKEVVQIDYHRDDAKRAEEAERNAAEQQARQTVQTMAAESSAKLLSGGIVSQSSSQLQASPKSSQLQASPKSYQPQALARGDTAGLESTEKLETKNLSGTDVEEDEDDEGFFGRLEDLRSGGSASLKNDPEKADKIVGRAMSALNLMRAKVGADLKYGVDVDDEMLRNQLFHNSETLQSLEDADFAVEASNLARFQILLQSSMKALEISRNLPKLLLDILDTVSMPMRSE